MERCKKVTLIIDGVRYDSEVSEIPSCDNCDLRNNCRSMGMEEFCFHNTHFCVYKKSDKSFEV